MPSSASSVADAQIPGGGNCIAAGTCTDGGVLDGVAVSLAVASVANSGVSSSSLGLFRPLARVALSMVGPVLVGRDMFVCAGLDAVDSAAAADRGWGGAVPAVAEAPAPTAAGGRPNILQSTGYCEANNYPR